MAEIKCKTQYAKKCEIQYVKNKEEINNNITLDNSEGYLNDSRRNSNNSNKQLDSLSQLLNDDMLENIDIFKNKPIEAWIISNDNGEYTEGFKDKDNIITYITTNTIKNNNLFGKCKAVNKQIKITKMKLLKNGEKQLENTQKKLQLTISEAERFLQRAKEREENDMIY